MTAVTEKLINSAQVSAVGGALSHSNAVYSPVVVSQYQHVRNFHRLMIQWAQNPSEFPFASEWINALTGVDNVKESVAHGMLVQQVERAHRLYPTLFPTPGGIPRTKSEVSNRYGNTTTNTTSSLPTDSAKLEEALVCHLSASYLCAWSALRNHSGGAGTAPAKPPVAPKDFVDSIPSPIKTPVEASVDDSENVVSRSGPLSLRPTPTELTNGPAKAPAPRPPLSGKRREEVVTHQPQKALIRMDIARAVCRPSSGGVRQKEPPIVDVVQNVLRAHEHGSPGTEAYPTTTATGNNNATSSATAASTPLRFDEHGKFSFSMEQAKVMRQQLADASQRSQHDAIIASLRSPRKSEERKHPIYYNESTVDAAGGGSSSRRPHTAGTVKSDTSRHEKNLVFGSTSLRAQAAQGVVVAAAHATTIPSVPTRQRPNTAGGPASSSWSSRIPEGGSTTVVVGPH